MTKREILLEQLEETVFALMMEDVAKEEGRKALEENGHLKADESAAVPETVYRKGLATIKRHFSQQNRQVIMRTTSKVISRVAVIVLVMLLLFTTAFATIPEFRSKALNLVMEVFDDRTRIELRDSIPEERTGENENLVGWIPDGFELVESGKTGSATWERYSNSEGAFVEANVYNGTKRACEVDTENAVIEEVTVNGYQAIIVLKGNSVQIVCPIAEEKRVYYVRSGQVNKDILLRVLESMDIK